MQWKTPKNTDKYRWTMHVAGKMRYYGLSEQKVLGVIRKPYRTETGIVENTVAVMSPAGTIKKDENKKEKWSQEVWVLYKLRDGEAISESQFPISKQREGIIKNIENIDKEKAKRLMKLMPKKLVIISAWRYPGMAPERDPIPAEIIRELEEMDIG